MRYEAKRSDTATKWYEINLMPLTGDDFAVIISYGVKSGRDGSGEDNILQPAMSIFTGKYLDAMDVISKKVHERLSIGYVKIETKQEE